MRFEEKLLGVTALGVKYESLIAQYRELEESIDAHKDELNDMTQDLEDIAGRIQEIEDEVEELFEN